MATKKILGLDLGVSSIGWALIEMKDDKASSILGMGSRIVPLTPDDSTQFSKGQAITKNIIGKMKSPILQNERCTFTN